MNSAAALHAADVGPLGFLLVGLAALVGALAIHFWTRRRRKGALPSPTLESYAEGPAAPEPAPLPPRPEGLPDWRHPDNPRPDIRQIAHLVREAAAKCGVNPETLPSFSPPDGSDGDFVYPDKFGTIYVSIERGGPIAEQECAVADELAYRILADRTWMKAYLATANQGLLEDERMRQVEAEQVRLLSLADPAWGRQAAWEQEVKKVRG